MSTWTINKAFGFSALIFTFMIGISNAAHAQECTLIVDAQTGATIEEKGACDNRYTAASTFKVALALMGYDTGVLTDAHTPLWGLAERHASAGAGQEAG